MRLQLRLFLSQTVMLWRLLPLSTPRRGFVLGRSLVKLSSCLTTSLWGARPLLGSYVWSGSGRFTLLATAVKSFNFSLDGRLFKKKSSSTCVTALLEPLSVRTHVARGRDLFEVSFGDLGAKTNRLVFWKDAVAALSRVAVCSGTCVSVMADLSVFLHLLRVYGFLSARELRLQEAALTYYTRPEDEPNHIYLEAGSPDTQLVSDWFITLAECLEGSSSLTSLEDPVSDKTLGAAKATLEVPSFPLAKHAPLGVCAERRLAPDFLVQHSIFGLANNTLLMRTTLLLPHALVGLAGARSCSGASAGSLAHLVLSSHFIFLLLL